MDLEQDNADLDPIDDAVIEDAPVEEAQPEPVTLETLASEMGWRPKDDWKGDPDKWKPAHDFMRATVDVNHKLTNRLKGVEDQLGRMARTSATMTERAVAAERDRLTRERDEAFDSGDREAFVRADRELAKVETVAAPVIPDETRAFVERNAGWFEKDQEATAWAVNRTNELAAQGLSPARQLSIVEREAKTLFPEHFTPAKPAAKVTPLNAPGNRAAVAARKGYAALPADAKKAADDYAKKGIDREEYAKIWWDENA